MPITRPDNPRVQSGAEQRVWGALLAQLEPRDALIANFRFTDAAEDHEADAIVLLPGFGAAVLEVKGGRVWCADGEWFQASGGGPRDAAGSAGRITSPSRTRPSTRTSRSRSARGG